MSTRPFILALAALLLVAGCKDSVSPAQTAAHLKAAQDLYAKKDYPAALVEIQAALKGDPRNGEAHYLAGEIQEALGETQTAFGEYARAAQPDANNLKAQLKVERILIEAKQFDTAIGRINGTLGSFPNDPDALALRALAASRQGARDKARADAQAALARMPGQPIAAAVLATDALAANNPDKALTALEPGLKAHPDDVGLIRLKAASLLAQNKKDDAIAIYKQLVEADPTSAANRAALAELDTQAGRTDEGEALLRQGVAASPGSNEMRLALIAFLNRYRGPEATDAELQAAIAAHPTEANFDLLRAEQFVRDRHPDQARAALDAAIARIPEGPARQSARLGVARLEISQGDTAEARHQLDAVLAVKPDNDDALLLRATLMARTNDAAAAVPDLLAVAGRQPRNVLPFELLANAYVQAGAFDKAMDALKKVTYFDPKNLQAALQLAQVGLQAGKPDIAKAALGDFVARNPDSIEGRVALVRLLMQQKDWAAARSAIDSLRRLPRADRTVALLGAEEAEAEGQPQAAMAAYSKLLGAGQSLDRDALQGLVRSAIAAKQVEPAVVTVSALANRSTGPDAALANLAASALYRAEAQTEPALAAARAAMAAAPKEPAGYLATASLQALPEAVATYDAGLAAGAPAEPLLIARGTRQDAAGDRAGAIASYKELLDKNPRSLIAANNYASLVADAQPTDKPILTAARQALEQAGSGNDPSVLDSLAWLDYRLGDLPSAKALLLRAKADTSPNPQLRYHFGAVLIALGDKEAGRSAVKSALSQPFPGHGEAERLLTE